MPRADPKLVEAAIRRARWGAFAHWARQFAVPIAVTVAMIGLFVFSITSPSRHVAWVGGEIVEDHRSSHRSGAVRAVTVSLDDGRRVTVMIPSAERPRAHRRVVVEVRKRDRPPRNLNYRFDHFEEPHAASATGP